MVQVIKADGTKEEFSREKVLHSIKRAGIPQSLQNEVMDKIEKELHEDITTRQIYKHIQDYLGKSNEPYLKGKYSLKQSIMELGPTGYPFEVYIAKLLEKEGYKTEGGVTLDGKCVSHEVDVIASKDSEKLMTECKFHNRSGTKSDIQVALYTKARFNDLKEKHAFTKSFLVTNTKITQDALDYAHCEDMKVMGWSYPNENSLRDLVEKHKLFPITTLTNLSQNDKKILLENDIVLARQICDDKTIINRHGLPDNKIDEIIKEAGFICNL